MPNAPLRYHIHLLMPDQLPRKVEVIDKISAGLDPRSDLVIVNRWIKNHHLLFEKKGEVLTVKLLAQSPTFLNNHPMEKERGYVIDHDDLIEAGKVVFHILASHGEKALPSRRPDFKPASLDLPSEEGPGEIAVPENDIGKMRKHPAFLPQKKKIPETIKQSSPIMLHLKVQALLVDFFFAYLLATLSLLLPEKYNLPLDRPEYLLVFALLMRGLFALLTGKSPAEWVLGLRGTKPHLLNRFVAFSGWSLLDQKNENVLFSFMRKLGFLFVIFWCLISPFFLPHPFQTLVSRVRIDHPLQKTLSTQTFIGRSKKLKLAFRADVPVEYELYPLYQASALPAYELVHLSSQKRLHIKAVKVIDHYNILKHLRFANPLAVKNQSRKISLKERLIEALTISPLNSVDIIVTDGPFVAGQFALKGELLRDWKNAEDIMLDEGSSSSLLISLTQNKKNQLLMVAPEKLIVFELTYPGPYQAELSQVALHTFLSQFYWMDEAMAEEPPSGEDLLSVFDELKRGNITALWTYYSFEARKLVQNSEQNRSAGLLFTEKKKQALMNVLTVMETDPRNETVAKSVAEIKSLLTDSGNKTNDRNSSGPQNVRKPKSKQTKNSRRR